MVSAGTKYGLRFIAELARNWGGGPVDAASVAARRGIPEAYLRKIATALKRAGLVEADRGQAGGYRLSRSPSEMSALDVFEALETPVSGPSGGGDPTDDVWRRMAGFSRAFLAKERIADLAAAPPGADAWTI